MYQRVRIEVPVICRFTRLGAADRNWLTEYLRIRDRPHPERAMHA